MIVGGISRGRNAFLGDLGFQKTAPTAAFGLDFFGLENQPAVWECSRKTA
jgi:hypothetical protein